MAEERRLMSSRRGIVATRVTSQMVCLACSSRMGTATVVGVDSYHLQRSMAAESVGLRIGTGVVRKSMSEVTAS